MIKLIPVFEQKGYIAGIDDGIVTVANKPASRKIYVLDSMTLQQLQTAISLPNGHYLIVGLDPNKQYLIICRDHNREYEPAVWDYVKPATDLTLAEQKVLWQQMQC
ncbi:hypothetical protein [Acinetobacter sp. c3-l95]|uniref:hypothetical protein n=1 Tax=Acinetobacter sp. c3-l95 TaxID=3342804 RepID=UPI0035BB9994